MDYLLGESNSKPVKAEFVNYNKEKLPRNIRSLRIEKNLHQSFLAAHVLNCAQSSYSQYETGKRTINVDILIALSRFYKVSIHFLIEGIETLASNK